MLKSNIIKLSLVISTSISISFAASDHSTKAQLKDESEFQKIIDEYKEYVATIEPEIRDEVIKYRKQVAQLNKEKILLYRKLSQQSQNYLKKEQQYKKKLPLSQRKLIKTTKD